LDMLKCFFALHQIGESIEELGPYLCVWIQNFFSTCTDAIMLEEKYIQSANIYVTHLVEKTLYPHCSRCKISQDKSDACNHMTCIACTSETCFICGKHFPTMISLSDFVDYKQRWKLGNISNSAAVSDTITWYDHECPIYSLKIFEEFIGLGEPFSSFMEKPANELKASWILRGIQVLVQIALKKIPVYDFTILHPLFPEFPFLTMQEGILFEYYSGINTVSQIKANLSVSSSSSSSSLSKSSCNYNFTDFFEVHI
jgi:hypothetical protein